MEIRYIKELNTICPNGYNVQKGGNVFETKKKIDLILNNAEPVIDVELGIEYLNIEDWLIKTNFHEFEQYNLYLNKNYRYLFKNSNNVKFYGECFPENATVYDIFTGNAIQYISLPIEKENIEDIKQRLNQLEAENNELKKQLNINQVYTI